jgi:hypothetical protein
MAYFYKPIGQHVEKEPSDELISIKRHDLFFITIGVITPEEGYLAILKLKDDSKGSFGDSQRI